MMYTRQHFLDSILHEAKVIKHLATKVPDAQLDYRPTPKQRSTLELLRYLTTGALVPTLFAINRTWDHAQEIGAAAESLTAEEFPAAMDAQMERIVAAVNAVSEEDFLTRDAAMPWGTPCKLGQALVDMVLKCLVAYRMQLFLYCKASGASEIGPPQCWMGIDPPAA